MDKELRDTRCLFLPPGEASFKFEYRFTDLAFLVGAMEKLHLSETEKIAKIYNLN